MTWKDKVFGNGSGFAEDTLYLATFHDGEEVEDAKVKFSYKVKGFNGNMVTVNRSKDNDRKTLIRWLQDHTDFDERDRDMTQMKSADHLVLIGHYKGYAYIQSVFPLGKSVLSYD